MNEEKKVSLAKEFVNISKKSKVKATYILRKEIESRTETQTIPLTEEFVDIKEVLVGHEIPEYPDIRTDGNTTIIPIVKEVETIVKKLILVKEIHVTKSQRTEQKEIEYRTRSEQIKIDRTVPGTENENEV